MKASSRNHRPQVTIETLAALLLLIVLTALTVLLIVSTGRTFKKIVDTGDTAGSLRTSLAFISTKVRQAEGKVEVRMSPFGQNALVITNTVAGAKYEDWVFFYGNELREAQIGPSAKLVPASSEFIAALDSLTIEQDGRKIYLSASKKQGTSGAVQTDTLTLALRTDSSGE